MVNTLEITPQAQAMAKSAEIMVKDYQGLVVTNNDQNKEAGAARVKIMAKVKELNETRKSMTGPLDDAKSRIMDFFRTPIERLEAARKNIDQAMNRFMIDEEAKRQQEQLKAEEAARKEAEKLQERAAKAAAAGKTDKAEALAQQAEEKKAVTPIVESKVDKVAGMTQKIIWKYRIINADIIPRSYWMIDETKIGATVRSTKGTLLIPGIEIYPEKVMSGTRS
jgi:hypothetical protein